MEMDFGHQNGPSVPQLIAKEDVGKMKIDAKELNRIIDEETEKFVEKVELREPALMQERLNKLSKEQILDLLKEESVSKEFILENASKHLLFKLFKGSKKKK